VFFYYTTSLAISLCCVLFLRNFIDLKSISSSIQRLFPVIECFLLGTFFYYFIVSKVVKTSIRVFSILLCFAFVFDYVQQKHSLSFLPLAIEGFFFLTIILFYFYERLRYISNVPIFSMPDFWVSSAFLINFSGTFFLYLFSISMSRDPFFRDQYHIIYGCFTIIKNILLCVAVYVNKIVENSDSKKSYDSKIEFANIFPSPTKLTPNHP